jgi:hypothetical protein
VVSFHSPQPAHWKPASTPEFYCQCGISRSATYGLAYKVKRAAQAARPHTLPG